MTIWPGAEHGPIPLREAQMRGLRPDEIASFEALIRTDHCLGFRKNYGDRLRTVAVHWEQWLVRLWSKSSRGDPGLL